MLPINLRPDDRLLRQFGCLCWLLLSVLSAHRWWRDGWDLTAVVQQLAAVSLLLLAIWRPSFLRVFYVGWSLAAFPVGWLMSHLLLFAMYFGVFWPTGCLLRLLGWDPLRLRASDDRSFWQDRLPTSDLKRYFRQY